MKIKKSLLVVFALGACSSAPALQSYKPASGEAATAYQVTSREFTRRMPGADVRPYADCVMSNATSDEVSKIATAGARAGDAIAQVVARPQTAQCIAQAAQRGRAAPASAQSAFQQPVAQPVFPQIQIPAMTAPSPQITMPGASRVTCTHVGVQTICR